MGLFDRNRREMRVARPGRSLTAAGERINAKRAIALNRLNSSWQKRAFAYYDELGEIKYAASFFARLQRLELFAGEWKENEEGERELVQTDDQQAIEALNRVKDPGGSGGRTNMLGTYARLMFLAGESILFYTVKDGEERWEMLSTSEIRPNPGGTGGYQRIKAPSLSPEEFREPGDDEWADVSAEEAIAYRFWRRHPQYSEWPDSPMRGVLELCEQLLMLDRSVRSRSLSRLAGNGILFIDDRISPAPKSPAPDEDPEEDAFLDDLTATMVEPIADETSAERVVPLVVRVPVPLEGGASLKDMIHHVRLTEPGELYPETGLRDEVLRRIAIGLEMPVEVLLGMGQANHWTAWEVSDEAWQHLEPYAQAFVDDLTSGYYLPTLKAANVENWANFAVGYDAGKMRTEPEQSKDAKDLWDRGAVGNRTLRAATGFDEDDAPTPEEQRIWLSIKSRDPGFALGGDPAGTTTADAEDVDQEEENAPTSTPGGARSEVEPGPPDRDDTEAEGLAGAAMREAQVLAAFEVGVGRAREVASNRVKSRAKAHPELAKLLEGLNGAHAPAVLGADHAAALGSPPELVAGAHSLLGGPLKRWGLTDAQTALILKAIEEFAAQTIYRPEQPPTPPQLRNYVIEVVRNRG